MVHCTRYQNGNGRVGHTCVLYTNRAWRTYYSGSQRLGLPFMHSSVCDWATFLYPPSRQLSGTGFNAGEGTEHDNVHARSISITNTSNPAVAKHRHHPNRHPPSRGHAGHIGALYYGLYWPYSPPNQWTHSATFGAPNRSADPASPKPERERGQYYSIEGISGSDERSMKLFTARYAGRK